MGTSAATESTNAGFFSSAKRMSLPLGPAIDPHAVRGYPIDMRVKAQSAAAVPVNDASAAVPLGVVAAQFGLGCYERWLAGEGEEWFVAAINTGRYLLERQGSDGLWRHDKEFGHTFAMTVPWISGMAQGEAASLLARLHLDTGEKAFAEAARAALRPLSIPVAQGGVCALLDGDPWPEEYPTNPPSFVLNGAIFALWGLRDVGLALGDRAATDEFERGVDVLARNLHRFDTGRWSLYCLYPFPVRNVSSSFYHALHISQLEAMNTLAPRPEFEMIGERWARYPHSAMLRRRAFAQKALFRLVIPRSSLLSRSLPWTPT
jgi:heparosan-N-sulfate-glucuronate 5-epimerase